MLVFANMKKGSILNNEKFPPDSEAYLVALDKTTQVMITDLSGTILYVNEIFCQHSKYTSQELFGQKPNLLKSGEHTEDFFKKLWETIKHEKVWTGQIRNMAKDGSFYWTQATMVPLLDALQKPYQFLSFGLDITQQKLEERALKVGNERLHILTQNFPNGSISIIDSQLNILITGGEGYESDDFRSEDIIGKPLKEALSPQTFGFIESQLPRVMKGETVSHEIFSKNRLYRNTYKPVYDSSGNMYGFVMVVQNITENHKALLEAQRKNDLFEIGEQIAQIGSWECNVKTMEITFSPNALGQFGIDPNQNKLKFGEMIEFLVPEDRIRIHDQFLEMIQKKKADLLEYKIIQGNGNVKILQSSGKVYEDEQGRVVRIIGVNQDITDKRKGELELMDSREMLKNIADSIPGLVMRYLEKPNGKDEIQYVSEGAELLWEIPREEVIKDENIVWKKIHSKDLRGFVKSFRTARANIAVWNYEYRIVMEDGRIKWINAIGTPKVMPEGNILWNILALDVSARKKAEELLEKNLHLLTYQNTQLVDFCNIVSHNLRSPLVNISMLIEFIEESESEEERMDFLEKLKPVIEHLNQTFEELVESIQIKNDYEVLSEKIEIEECYAQVIAGFEGEIHRSQALIEKDFSEAPVIYYPHKYFISILNNLISNSFKYRSPERKLEVMVKTIKKGKSIILSVQDNGLGIDLKKHKENLFKIRKVFHRHPDAKGFGLFITKTQVEVMKGKIWVESTPNVGSTFFVEFKNQYI